MSQYQGWREWIPPTGKVQEEATRVVRQPVGARRPTAATVVQSSAATAPLFPRVCVAAGLPEPTPEYRFGAPRRWRFDWAWLDQRVALEVQGGIFQQGRHTRGAALLKEHEKLNAAAAAGWRVVFCTPTQVENGEAIVIVSAALASVGDVEQLGAR